MHLDHHPVLRALRPFDPAQAGPVAAWAGSATEARWWAGVAGFPVPAATVVSWQEDPDARGYLLYEDAEPVAYGEIWDDAEEAESELAHLIVHPAARGRGLGRALVHSLVPLAGFDALLMRVHPDNSAARRCYVGAGFAVVDEERAAEWNVPQPVPYVWLEQTRQQVVDDAR